MSVDRRTFVKGLVAVALAGGGLLAYSPVLYKIVKPKARVYKHTTGSTGG